MKRTPGKVVAQEAVGDGRKTGGCGFPQEETVPLPFAFSDLPTPPQQHSQSMLSHSLLPPSCEHLKLFHSFSPLGSAHDIASRLLAEGLRLGSSEKSPT